MQIHVTAVHREGFRGVWTPQTLWLSKQPTPVEVLDNDTSPERRAGEAISGMKIGRTELAELRKTPGLIVSGVDQTNAVEMTAQLAEAHKAHAEVVAAMKGAAEQLALEIARLQPFEARAKEQEQTIADLRARIARASGNAPKQPEQPRR